MEFNMKYISNYVENKLDDLTRNHINDYWNDTNQLTKERQVLVKTAEPYLPKIKGIKVCIALQYDDYNRRDNSPQSIKYNKLTELLAEIRLDKNLKDKTLLDQKIEDVALEINLSIDKLYQDAYHNFKLLKRRINRFIKSRKK